MHHSVGQPWVSFIVHRLLANGLAENLSNKSKRKNVEFIQLIFPDFMQCVTIQPQFDNS